MSITGIILGRVFSIQSEGDDGCSCIYRRQAVARSYCAVDVHDPLENINLILVCPRSAAAHLMVPPSPGDGVKVEQISWHTGSVRAVADRNYEQRRARRNNTANEHNEVK